MLEQAETNSKSTNSSTFTCNICGKSHETIESYAKCVSSCAAKKAQEEELARKKKFEEECEKFRIEEQLRKQKLEETKDARLDEIIAASDRLKTLLRRYENDFNVTLYYDSGKIMKRSYAYNDPWNSHATISWR